MKYWTYEILDMANTRLVENAITVVYPTRDKGMDHGLVSQLAYTLIYLTVRMSPANVMQMTDKSS